MKKLKSELSARRNLFQIFPTCLTVVMLALAFYFGSCKNEVEPSVANPTSTTGAFDTEQLVMTPWGLRPLSHVHAITAEQHVNIAGDDVQIIDNKTGEVVQSFKKDNNALTPASEETPSTTSRTETGGNGTGTGGQSATTNWTSGATWTYPLVSSSAINYFTTTMIVPSVPQSPSMYNNGVYLFGVWSGLETSDHNNLLQTVLQYGQTSWVDNTGLFHLITGGNFWSIASWSLIGNQYVVSSSVQVSPGTSLTSTFVLNSVSGSNYNYTASFTGQSATLAITNSPKLVNALETLEAYTYASNGGYQMSDSYYPADAGITMTSIGIQFGGVLQTPTWNFPAYQTTTTAITGSPAGIPSEVDIFLHGCPLTTPVAGIALSCKTLSWTKVQAAYGYSINITSSPNGSEGSTYNTTSNSIADLFSTMAVPVTPGNYQITVTPRYSCTGTASATTYSFTYATPAPLAGVTGITWVNSPEDLLWTAVPGATSYTVVVTGGPDGSGATFTTTATAIQSLFFSQLGIADKEGTYTFTITPKNACITGSPTSGSFTHTFDI